jgi:excinuclease UvrABC ATPase subunit
MPQEYIEIRGARENNLKNVSNSRITLDVYTQAVNSNKRAAQSKVVRMIVSDVGQKVEEYPETRQ